MSKKETQEKAKLAAMHESQAECPIFLRKTYHMIDTADPAVACWSDDGETFVVKDTEVFEKVLIPQFFKHSKFSSFVRQLNFYGFRKIKYADTIRIDPKLEAETANFWRFRHEKFRRGKPELLVEIKRSSGQNASPTATAGTKKTEDSGALKSEVSTLKKRIEAMTKNIDELTSLVQKVSLKQESDDPIKEDPDAQVGSKRKKVDLVRFEDIRPDVSPSSTVMDLDQDLATLPEIPTPASPSLSRRQSSSELSDNDFVDQLFTAFGNEETGGLLDMAPLDIEPLPPTPEETDNAPDPQLMKRLSDTLSLLPREIQEMIVNKLIASIMSTDLLEKNVNAATALADSTTEEVKTSPSQVPPSPVMGAKPQPEVSLSLAAATLAAFLSEYGAKNVKDKAVLQKTVPVIPIHA